MDNKKTADDAVKAVQKLISNRPLITKSDDYLLIHHTDGLEPYELKEIEILLQHDLINTLKRLSKKNWMTVEIAIDLVEGHFHLCPQEDPYLVRKQYLRNHRKG